MLRSRFRCAPFSISEVEKSSTMGRDARIRFGSAQTYSTGSKSSVNFLGRYSSRPGEAVVYRAWEFHGR
jgi:hypothetical protein